MAAKTMSLVDRFDEIVASTDILVAGTEGMFAQFVSSQMGVHSQVGEMAAVLATLKSQNASIDIKLKHAHLKFKEEMNKRQEMEELLQQYEKQFTIIHEVLGNTTKLNELNDQERRSLAFLKEATRKSSTGTPRKSVSVRDESSVTLSPSEVDLDAADVDVSLLRNGAKWVRTQNMSTESKKRLSEESEVKEKKRFRASFSPTLPTPPRVPRLDREFRRPPPPHQNKRRMPSRGHLRYLATIESEAASSDDAMEIAGGGPSLLPPHSNFLPPHSDFLPPITSETELDSDTPVPSAPPLPPRIYPSLPPSSQASSDTATDKESVATSETEEAPTPLPLPSPSTFSRSSRTSEINMRRHHTFFTKTLMRIETCQVCNKKIRFGRNCLKCRDCRCLCHPECKTKVPLPCIPSVATPKKMQDAGLASFCPSNIPRVPALLVHCVTEIERRGLTDVGLYRVPGSDKMKKEVKERLLKVRGQPFLDKVGDVNVLCSVLKDFLSSLREPILTFRLHKTFLGALDAGGEEDILACLFEALAELPPCNKDTLAFIILHLKKVASFSDANKMPVESLAKVFGPTLVGHASSKPDPSVQWKDAEKQPEVVLRLLNISPDYWRQYLSPMDNPEPVTSPVAGSAQSSPGFNSPCTPEQRPVPESPFLGSCQSPRSRGAAGRTGVPSTPTTFSARRNGNFFPSLN